MSDTSPNGRIEDDDEKSNGQRAYEFLGEFLRADGWYPQSVPESHAYRMAYSGGHAELRCVARVNIEAEQFFFYAIATIKVPEGARPAVAEFLTRANYGLRIGNFEMDFSDGEVRYKSSLDFEGDSLSGNLIRNAIYPAVNNLDEYMPGLLKVAFGSTTPQEAIQEIEG
jgi:hypothetical protein